MIAKKGITSKSQYDYRFLPLKLLSNLVECEQQIATVMTGNQF